MPASNGMRGGRRFADGPIRLNSVPTLQTLTGVQEKLLTEVLKVQPKVVVVLVHGGPIASTVVAEDAPAVIDAFYPGELGGDAIVSTLLGENNPGGKMPYTTYHANFTVRCSSLSSSQPPIATIHHLPC
jgi:hypothetical protein